MSKRTIISMATSESDHGPAHAIIWVTDLSVLARARDELRSLRGRLPGVEELILEEGHEKSGLVASFGDLDLESLEGTADEDAAFGLEEDHWAVLADPDAPIASLLEDAEEDFGSIRVHVREDFFYVTACYDGDDRAATHHVSY